MYFLAAANLNEFSGSTAVKNIPTFFDNKIYVEFEEQRLGAYVSVSRSVPLNYYRKFRRGRVVEQGDKIRQLAEQQNLLISVLSGTDIVIIISRGTVS